MLLRSLTLTNIGVYAGPQTVHFSTSPERPITLIGGQNGSGKTSLLEAISLALYGKRARRILGASAYPEYLNELVHYGTSRASVRVEFERTEDGRQIIYEVERAWARSVRGKATEALYVSANGESRPDLAAAWPEFVEGVMPMAVSELAIFDAEKIEALADPGSSTEVLKTSLFGLLGLDLIDKLHRDLGEYRRRVARESTSSETTSLSTELAHAEDRLAAVQGDADSAVQEYERIEDDLAEQRGRLDVARSKLAKSGGGLFARREELHTTAATTRARLEVSQRDLLSLAGSELPLVMLSDLLKRVVSAGDQRKAAQEAALLADEMARRDAQMVHTISSHAATTPDFIALIVETLANDLDSRERPEEPEFGVSPSAKDEAELLLGAHRVSLLEQASSALTDFDDSVAALDEVERTLLSVPDSARIASVVEEVAATEANVLTIEASLGRQQRVVEDFERRTETARRSVDRFAHALLEAGAADQNTARLAREVSKAETALEEFAARVLAKNLGRITAEITDALRSLFRKQGLVDEVRIDPETLKVILVGPDGREVDPGKLSAGERQILATAVLWGLSRSTGMNLPTVIDTPVGRLDGSHRLNLVERYFPFAARQVVLLSTDQEIIGSYKDQLDAKTGETYLLDFNEETGATRIVNGYFND
jgi:DNA sulfur modification protein DndD